jgi:hypothetical protein
MFISLDGIESGSKPDFNIILCPRSLAKNVANPAPNPFLPVQSIMYSDLLNGYVCWTRVVCEGLKYSPGAILLFSSLTPTIFTLFTASA